MFIGARDEEAGYLAITRQPKFDRLFDVADQAAMTGRQRQFDGCTKNTPVYD